jgi:type IV secretory pathway protease TraF
VVGIQEHITRVGALRCCQGDAEHKENVVMLPHAVVVRGATMPQHRRRDREGGALRETQSSRGVH